MRVWAKWSDSRKLVTVGGLLLCALIALTVAKSLTSNGMTRTPSVGQKLASLDAGHSVSSSSRAAMALETAVQDLQSKCGGNGAEILKDAKVAHQLLSAVGVHQTYQEIVDGASARYDIHPTTCVGEFGLYAQENGG